MLDQHPHPEKLRPLGWGWVGLGGRFIAQSSLNFPSGFKGAREKQRRLVEAAQMSYFTPLHPAEVTQIHSFILGGLQGKNRAPFGKRLLS